jgi:CheY-like chemotaxis protein
MALILVVEDDKSMNEVLKETLEDEGHEVETALNGKEALQLAETRQFDLAVSDVRLPGMDGVETLTRLKAAQPGIKTIVITGYASADTPVRAIRLKVDDYLFKPFSLVYFLNSVSRTLEGERAREIKFSLVQKLFSVFGRSRDQVLSELVEERQSAFRGLYLGSRSGYLSRRAASEVYNKLELLEEKFRGLLNNPEAEPKTIRDVQEMYRMLSDRIASLELGAEEAANEGIIPVEHMTALYEAVRSSQIGLDDLQYAPLLRKTPDERFETLKELLDLKRRLWPGLAQV